MFHGIIATEIQELFKKGKPIKLRFGYRETKEGATYEEGMFIIDSFEVTTPAKEESTYSASFSNTGEVKTVAQDASSTKPKNQ